MSVQEITTDQLRRMEGKEGLILQGCGGSLLDWQNGDSEEWHPVRNGICVPA